MKWSAVQNEGDAIRAAEALAASQRLFIDTEFDSSRRGQKLSLIQVRGGPAPGGTECTEAFVIDVLALPNSPSVRRALDRPDGEWVLHAGGQDVDLLRQQAGVEEPARLLDTQVGWGLIGPENGVSLSHLVFQVCGERRPKSHQADDWLRRPLPESQWSYAAADVQHLPAIADFIEQGLEHRGRPDAWPDVTEEIYRPPTHRPSKLSLRSYRNAWQLSAASQLMLRGLIEWYNGLASEERSIAPTSKSLFNVASRLPRRRADLGRLKGVSRRTEQLFGARIVGIADDAARRAQSEEVERLDPPPYASWPEVRLSGWLQHARAEVAAGSQIALELAFPNRIVNDMKDLVLEARSLEASAEALTGWRRDALHSPWSEFCQHHSERYSELLA